MVDAILAEHTFDAGDVRLNYVEGPPTGPPLVLLHGGSADWRMFRPVLPHLSPRFQLFAMDMRGHGRSARTPGSYRARDFAGDVCAFISECVGKSAAIYGHSWGATVALMAAADCPDAVRALVLGDIPVAKRRHREELGAQWAMLQLWQGLAGGAIPVTEIERELRKMPVPIGVTGATRPAEEALGADSPWFQWMPECLYHHDPDFLSAVSDRFDDTFEGWDGPELLPPVRCPVLMLLGDPALGGLVTEGDVAEARSYMPSVQIARLWGVGHAHMIDAPQVASVMVPFLEPVQS